MTRREVIGEFEARRVARTLKKLFLGRLRRDESLSVSGWMDDGWLEVRWELENADRSEVYPVEARIQLRDGGLRQAQARDLLYDFLGHFFDDYLRSGREPFTGPEWERVEFAGRSLYVRGQVQNDAATREANALLRNGAEIATPNAAQSNED